MEAWLNGRTPLISYARISADRLDGDAIGVGRQHRNNIRSAGLHDCVVVLHYEDNNITAAKRDGERRAFLQMCRDISHGQEDETGIPVRGCVAVEQERVYRLPRDFIAFQDALTMVGDGLFIEGETFVDLSKGNATVIATTKTAGAAVTRSSPATRPRARTPSTATTTAVGTRIAGVSAERWRRWTRTSKDWCSRT
ncbi:hypothetical protein [Streptomyces sp. NBC_01353]|uniref:hypothetical protein n=1 Tax=Streptomyces sp. NBC_01353 TaxID=2903835 RepID=UPI002E32E5FB|nr:hypothetical protein [Streptomyces sp. NBC_01353]